MVNGSWMEWSEHAGWDNEQGIDFNLICDRRCGIEDVHACG